MKKRRRRWQASWRDTKLLLREFRIPLTIFTVTMIGGGMLYQRIGEAVGEPVHDLSEAVYLVLTLSFLQPSGDFPNHPYLEAFYFIMPLIGLGILAQGLADFGIMLFNRNTRSKEWEMAIASTLNNHTILVGLGHLGFRVVQHLVALGKKVAVIEMDPKDDLIDAVREMGIPVIQDDASRETALETAQTFDLVELLVREHSLDDRPYDALTSSSSLASAIFRITGQLCQSVRQGRQEHVQVLSCRPGAAGKIHDQRPVAHSDYGTRHHGMRRLLEAFRAHRLSHSGNFVVNHPRGRLGSDITRRQARTARGHDQGEVLII